MLTLEAAPVAGQAGVGESTLDELILDAWEGLASGHVVCCPVCASAMARRQTATADGFAGRCTSCGAALD